MNKSVEMSRQEILRLKLEQKRQEHRQLDQMIAQEHDGGFGESLEMRRLKKKKLMLKDEIARLEDETTPDIIA
jgi:hypothetical protein